MRLYPLAEEVKRDQARARVGVERNVERHHVVIVEPLMDVDCHLFHLGILRYRLFGKRVFCDWVGVISPELAVKCEWGQRTIVADPTQQAAGMAIIDVLSAAHPERPRNHMNSIV